MSLRNLFADTLLKLAPAVIEAAHKRALDELATEKARAMDEIAAAKRAALDELVIAAAGRGALPTDQQIKDLENRKK